jgi:hypothetical protein
MAQTEAMRPMMAMKRLRRTGALGRSPSFRAAGGRMMASTLPMNMAPPIASTSSGSRLLPRKRRDSASTTSSTVAVSDYATGSRARPGSGLGDVTTTTRGRSSSTPTLLTMSRNISTLYSG